MKLAKCLALALLSMAPLAGWAANGQKPKIRAVTGFIDIDPGRYREQIADAVQFLSRIRAAEEALGYEVSTIRISTQPFPEFTRRLSHAQALDLLRGIDGLAAKWQFTPHIGPAMLDDNDDPAAVDLLIDALSAPGNRLGGNLIVAAEDGIHWNAVRQAARVIHAVGERSPHGQGNFNFAAIAMLKPFGPFYPGAWHGALNDQCDPRRFTRGYNRPVWRWTFSRVSAIPL